MDETRHDDDAVVVRPRWWALPAAAVGCLVFVALGVVLIASGGAFNVAVGVLSLVFFASRTPHGAGTVAKALADLTAAGELVNPRDRRGYRLPDWPRRPRTRSLF